MIAVKELRFRAFDVALLEPFGIAGGAQEIARNVLIELELADGSVGLGEAAPFPAVSGETQKAVLTALEALAPNCAGKDASRYRVLCEEFGDALRTLPSALAGVEMALLDALCRRARLSLWHFFGARETTLSTDITIPTGDAQQPIVSAQASARRAAQMGFGILKIKIGRDSCEIDAARIRAIAGSAPAARLILDANASLTAAQALELLAALGPVRSRLVLFEQPTARDDLAGLVEVEREGQIAVAADESATSYAAVARLGALGGVSVVNIKTAKSGLLGAWDMARIARAHGMRLMIGGMVETELSMTASACLAAGLGGFDFVDLDTPLFMGPRPLRGGFRQHGPLLELGHIEAGHGVHVVST